MSISYGDRVIVTDASSRWYAHIGVVAGKNKDNIGVRFEDDPNPPATGNWLPKGHLQPISEVNQPVAICLAAVEVREARVVHDLPIPLVEHNARHLIFTGPNGSGKSTIVAALHDALREAFSLHGPRRAADAKVDLTFTEPLHVVRAAAAHRVPLLAFIPSARRWSAPGVQGPAEIDWQDVANREFVADLWMQHLVNQRTALSFAREDGAEREASRLQTWMDEFLNNLRRLLDRPGLELPFDRQRFRFMFELDGRSVDFAELPDGFASLLSIWAEIALREEAHRRLYGSAPTAGVVLIDEVETHLHLRLQELVLGVLTSWFSRYQFIVTTHAAPVLSSVENAVVVDLGSRAIMPSRELRGIPYGDLMTGHFGIESDLDLDTTHLRRRFYEAMQRGDSTTVAELAHQLSARSATLSVEVWRALQGAISA